MDPAGRLFQDRQFEVAQLRGRFIERVGYLRIGQLPEPDGHILYVKPIDGSWNRAFLDAGFAVWEDWGDAGSVPEDVDDEADVRFIDCSGQFSNRVVKRAFAESQPDQTPRISIEFQDGGRIELRHVDETNWESADITVLHATA